MKVYIIYERRSGVPWRPTAVHDDRAVADTELTYKRAENAHRMLAYASITYKTEYVLMEAETHGDLPE